MSMPYRAVVCVRATPHTYNDRGFRRPPYQPQFTMTNLQTLTPIFQEFRQEVEKLYGARLVKLILFGSQARGEATQESDIDIMVVLKSPVLPGDEIIRMADIATQLDLKYNEFISLIPIAEEDFLHRQSPFMENIHREGIVL